MVYAAAYVVRPWVTDEVNRKYFLPALTVRILGALAVGFVYQFYYGNGDTFMYHSHGSRHIWNAFTESPLTGLKLLFAEGKVPVGGYEYASRIYFFKDPQSYAVIKLAAVFDLLTFSSYSATAILFACLSFIGMWLFFQTFYEQYPGLHRSLANASLFIPSVFFWGSGILKDTVTLSCVGAGTFFIYRVFIRHELRLAYILMLALALYGLYAIKIYILLTFLPAVIIWIFFHHYNQLRSLLVRIILLPIVICTSLFLAYLTIEAAAKDHTKYSLSRISKTAQITSYDIRYWSGREAGSGYSLGTLDGTWQSMFMMAPAGISVSLFRPFLWEIKNPLMLLSALESLLFSVLTLYVIVRLRTRIFQALQNPSIFFSLVFSITFAFAVGVSTFNFGTLARYKIPLIPFYAVALVLLLDHSKRLRNREAVASTE